jgi:hypothetical protein
MPMILRYLASLAVIVFLVTLPLTSLQFATYSHIRTGDGEARDENVHFEFTIAAAEGKIYVIGPAGTDRTKSLGPGQ